jgi:prepilin-type N-terminal cleavage/methylation domain-containing protein
MAFTLVELLVVIAIVAVLAALLFPAVSSAVRKGNEVDAAQDLRSLYAGTMLYAAENNGEMFFCMDSGGPLGWRGLWVDKLTPYLPAKGTITQQRGRNDAFYNKGIKEADRWVADYAPSDNVLRENNEGWGNFPSGAPRMTLIREPSKEILYLEGANNDATKNPMTSGSFTLWSKMAIEGNFDYPNTIARRQPSLFCRIL